MWKDCGWIILSVVLIFKHGTLNVVVISKKKKKKNNNENSENESKMDSNILKLTIGSDDTKSEDKSG